MTTRVATTPVRVALGREPRGAWKRLVFHARELVWGLVLYDFWRELETRRRRYQDAMNVVLMGEFLGIPTMSSVITLRLLPYLLPDLKGWKARQLREAEVLEEAPAIH